MKHLRDGYKCQGISTCKSKAGRYKCTFIDCVQRHVCAFALFQGLCNYLNIDCFRMWLVGVIITGLAHPKRIRHRAFIFILLFILISALNVCSFFKPRNANGLNAAFLITRHPPSPHPFPPHVVNLIFNSGPGNAIIVSVLPGALKQPPVHLPQSKWHVIYMRC